MHNLAVYGTLKKAYHNHRVLGESEYLGSCWVDNFALAREGAYPAAFRFAGRRIWVEVYNIDEDTLARTDRLEGVESNFYKRIKVETSYGDAYMYTVPDSKTLVAHTDKWYPDGVWEGATYRVQPWLGWATEIELRDESDQRRRNAERNAASVPVSLMPHRSGRLVKVHNVETGEVEYVPAHEATYVQATDSYIRKTDDPSESAARAAAWIDKNKNNSTACAIYLPAQQEPKKRTFYQLARARIEEGVKQRPNIPEEKIA